MNLLYNNDVILLLGAGASAEAEIPFTAEMIEDLEKSLEAEDGWKEFKKLYDFIKEQKHLLNKDKPLNIEELVNIIDELSLLIKKEHPLTIINLSWVSFMEKLGYTTTLLEDFKKQISDKLKEWIFIEDKMKPVYYNDIAKFQIQYNSEFRIFTLNYDKCVEDYCHTVKNTDREINEGKDFNLIIERGFGNEQQSDDQKLWDYKKFIQEGLGIQIYLYKMHGSIDWERNKDNKTERRNNINKIKNFDIIFGTQQKVKAYDPYLFFLYEFRERSLQSKVICISGYGFGDDHINKILTQAFDNGTNRPLLLVNTFSHNEEDGRNFVSEKLKINEKDRIKIIQSKASYFFKNNLQIDFLKKLYYGDTEDILPF